MKPSVRSAVALAALLAAGVAPAAVVPVEAPRPAAPVEPVDPGVVRHVLIVAGLPGDEEHRKAFGETVEKLSAAFRDRWGVAPEHLHVLSGTGDDGRPAADREGLAREAERLAAAGSDEAVWVIVVGHAYFDGKHSWLNLPGDDVEQAEFAKLFAGLQAREQVFFLTQSVSGFYVKPLSREGRVVVAATEPALEVNATLFPLALAEAVDARPDKLDEDGDGRATLFDLYVAVARRVADRYAADETIPTEHSQLDDDGDGRATELQLDYLPPEQGGRFAGSPPPPRSAGDGVRSAEIRLPTGG